MDDSRQRAVDPEAIHRWWTRFFQPIADEDDGYEVTDVVGEIPREIHGTLYRNGPSQKIAPPEGAGALHLFDGDGLVQAFRFDDGRLRHQSRFVRNPSFLCEERAGRFNQMSVGLGAADPSPEVMRQQHNTNIVHHAGRLMALVENALPFLLDPSDLGPRGTCDLDGRALGMSVTAHPKIDARTGQLWIHGYQPFPPYLALYCVEPDGRVSLAEEIECPYPTMMHDFAITEHHVIFQLTPVLFQMELGEQGPVGVPADWFRWQPDRGLRFGIRRREPGSAVRWFDAPTPRFIFHPGNAYEAGSEIVMDAVAYRNGQALLDYLRVARSGGRVPGWEGTPIEYRFDLERGTCRERDLDDRGAEFPRLDDRLVGYENRFGYAVMSDEEASWHNLVKYDRRGGPLEVHRFGTGHWPGEPVFVPRSSDAAEDEGYVLSVVYDAPNDASYLAVLDARNVAGAPLATCRLRHRIPLGFHGNFASGVF